MTRVALHSEVIAKKWWRQSNAALKIAMSTMKMQSRSPSQHLGKLMKILNTCYVIILFLIIHASYSSILLLMW